MHITFQRLWTILAEYVCNFTLPLNYVSSIYKSLIIKTMDKGVHSHMIYSIGMLNN